MRHLEERVDERARPQFTGWPVERWLTVITLVSVILGGVGATVLRWHDVDVLTEKEAGLEKVLESIRSNDDVIYVRKDLNDERLRTINEKLDALGVKIDTLVAKK